MRTTVKTIVSLNKKESYRFAEIIRSAQSHYEDLAEKEERGDIRDEYLNQLDEIKKYGMLVYFDSNLNSKISISFK